MKKLPRPKAFSLIEISIVILIVAILVAGTITGSILVAKARLSSAKALTQSSPVLGIKDLVLWLETTATESLLDSETLDGTPITKWFDINKQSVDAKTYIPGSSPTYKKSCINGLPCVAFDNVNYLTVDSSYQIPTINSLTIFIVMETPSEIASTENPILRLGDNVNLYVANGRITLPYEQPSLVGLLYLTPYNEALKPKTNYIFSLVDDASTITSYFNGSYNASATSVIVSNTIIKKSFDSVIIGNASNPFSQNIAEIIVFSRNLKQEERKSVEEYLGQKWGIAVSS